MKYCYLTDITSLIFFNLIPTDILCPGCFPLKPRRARFALETPPPPQPLPPPPADRQPSSWLKAPQLKEFHFIVFHVIGYLPYSAHSTRRRWSNPFTPPPHPTSTPHTPTSAKTPPPPLPPQQLIDLQSALLCHWLLIFLLHSLTLASRRPPPPLTTPTPNNHHAYPKLQSFMYVDERELLTWERISKDFSLLNLRPKPQLTMTNRIGE